MVCNRGCIWIGGRRLYTHDLMSHTSCSGCGLKKILNVMFWGFENLCDDPQVVSRNMGEIVGESKRSLDYPGSALWRHRLSPGCGFSL